MALRTTFQRLFFDNLIKQACLEIAASKPVTEILLEPGPTDFAKDLEGGEGIRDKQSRIRIKELAIAM